MRTRVSAYALALNDGHVLLTQLAPQCYNAGKWTLPGGGMDFGEQPTEALAREVYEETGLTPAEPVLLHARSFSEETSRGPYMAVQLVYRADVAGAPQVVEKGGSTADARWVSLDDIADLPTLALVDDALSRLPGG